MVFFRCLLLFQILFKGALSLVYEHPGCFNGFLYFLMVVCLFLGCHMGFCSESFSIVWDGYGYQKNASAELQCGFMDFFCQGCY